MKKLFLVVIYKCRIENSTTCQFIKEQNLIDSDNIVFIWDNSPNKDNSIEIINNFFGGKNVIYKHTPENLSLSKIYNTILKEYASYDAIQIFDQDSFIQKNKYNNYLDRILEDEKDINIFLPKIYSNNFLYSPGKLYVFKGVHFKDLDVGINKCNCYTAIGSGLLFRPQFCIKNGIYFSEELKLYSVDTDFAYKCCKISPYFYVMDLDFSHDLSENALTHEERKRRRKLQLEGLLFIYKKDFVKKFLTKLYIFFLKLIGRV